MNPISPIQVRPDIRYFVDPNGQPVFWLGDTQWELFRLFTVDEAMHILEDRRTKGFSVILIMLTGVSGDGKAPYPNLEDETPWVDDNPGEPNEKYFQHVDSVIRLGERTDQVFVVGVYHKWHVDFFPTQTAQAWARWIGQRYRDVPNLIWSMYPEAKDEYIPVSRALADGLQDGDGGTHLISVHPDPSVASSSFLHDEPWLPFNMIQPHNTYDRIYDTVTDDYRRTPIKPVVMAEAGYEGAGRTEPITPLAIRRQAYWSQLAGGHHVYGHDQAYLSGPATVSLRLDALSGGQARATWIDPTNADRLPAGSCPTSGAQSFSTPEEWEDAVLLIEGV